MSARVASGLRIVWSISAAIAGIDLGQPLARRDAVGAGGDDFLRVLGAGLDAALHAAGADLVRQIEAFAFFRSAARAASDAREDFLADLGDEFVQFRVRHDVPFSEYLLLDFDDFLDPRLMPSTGERRRQPGAQNFFRLGLRSRAARRA